MTRRYVRPPMNGPKDVPQDFSGMTLVSVPTLVDAAAYELRKLIFSGQMKPGEHLVEERLTARLGVSRAPPFAKLLASFNVTGSCRRLTVTGSWLWRSRPRMCGRSIHCEWHWRGLPLNSELRYRKRADWSRLSVRWRICVMRPPTAMKNHPSLPTAHSIGVSSGLPDIRDWSKPTILQMQMRLCMAYNLEFRQRLYSDPQDSVVRHQSLLTKVIEGDTDAVLDGLKHHGAASFLDHLDELLGSAD